MQTDFGKDSVYTSFSHTHIKTHTVHLAIQFFIYSVLGICFNFKKMICTSTEKRQIVRR